MISENQPTINPTGAASVLVCTRNRPDDLLRALPGILAQDYPDYEVVLVDQSTDDVSHQRVMADFGNNPRLRYIRTPTVGLSISRNLALESAANDICAFTDDDCDVPPNWLSNIMATYATHPETCVLFSPVYKPSDMPDAPDLFFPCLYFNDDRVLRHGEIFGMGANMSMRRSFWKKTGPFDAMLGPGTPMPGSDEHDWLYRAHLAGAVIRLEPKNGIVHRAWRTGDQWMRLTRTYSFGDAAFAMKHVRCGDVRMWFTAWNKLAYMTARYFYRVICRGDYRYEMNYVLGYWAGMWASFKYPVDRSSRLFRTAPAAVGPMSGAGVGGTQAERT